MKHKHCEVIKAWADGAQIQYKDHESGRWEDIDYPAWHDATQHRIKPKPLEWYEQIPSHGVLCWVDDYSKADKIATKLMELSGDEWDVISSTIQMQES